LQYTKRLIDLEEGEEYIEVKRTLLNNLGGYCAQ
jgi:hypothetical protein